MTPTVSGVASPEGSDDATMMICRPTNKTSGNKKTSTTTTTTTKPPSRIPPPFVVDSDGKKLFRSACRARAVAKDHTPETAYLLIPEDVQHGHILRCSHPWCLKTGRLFRYCVVCRQPVTKRNFHKRHGHGLIRYEQGRSILPCNELVVSSSTSSMQASPSTTPLPPPNTVPPVIAVVGDTKQGTPTGTVEETISLPSSTAATTVPVEVPSASTNMVSDEELSATQPSSVPVAVVVVEQPPPPITTSSTAQGIVTTVTPEELAWLQLFRERPPPRQKDPEAMSKWFASIVSTCYPQEEEQQGSSPQTTTTGVETSLTSLLPYETDDANSDLDFLDTFDLGIQLKTTFEDYEMEDFDTLDLGIQSKTTSEDYEMEDFDLDFLLD